MSDENLIHFDKFLESISDIQPALLRTNHNWRTLRSAALKLYGLLDTPGTLVTSDMLANVFLNVRQTGKLEFAKPPAPKPKEHYNLDSSGRPVKPFQRSAYQSADDKKSQAAKENEEAFNVAKAMKDAVVEKRERAQREAEENVVILFETGRFQGRCNHGATDDARKAARAKWAAIDKQRGITNG